MPYIAGQEIVWNNMALLESCCGCALDISSAALGVYLMVAYIIAFLVELWWIIDYSVTSPVAAYILCTGYFVLFAFSMVLLRGLSTKRTTFLLVWLFTMGILLGPEAGLVLYVSIHHWRITSVNGLIETTCWACRLLVSIVGILNIQSLQSIWREEKSVMLRLESLKKQTSLSAASTNDAHKGMGMGSGVLGYRNYGCEDKEATDNDGMDTCLPLKKGLQDGTEKPLAEAEGTGQMSNYFPNEFHASTFDPAVIDARLVHMPYLTIRQRPKDSHVASSRSRKSLDLDFMRGQIKSKAHSLMDLSRGDLDTVNVLKCSASDGEKYPAMSGQLPFVNENADNEALDCDSAIIKNKHLKILKRFSPFFSKKSNATINIYRINPPKSQEKLDMSNLDQRLNRIYKSRGMYAFNDDIRRIVFYPPEFFRKPPDTSRGRVRLNSCGSTISQSSLESEDAHRIRDVAL